MGLGSRLRGWAFDRLGLVNGPEGPYTNITPTHSFYFSEIGEYRIPSGSLKGIVHVLCCFEEERVDEVSYLGHTCSHLIGQLDTRLMRCHRALCPIIASHDTTRKLTIFDKKLCRN